MLQVEPSPCLVVPESATAHDQSLHARTGRKARVVRDARGMLTYSLRAKPDSAELDSLNIREKTAFMEVGDGILVGEEVRLWSGHGKPRETKARLDSPTATSQQTFSPGSTKQIIVHPHLHRAPSWWPSCRMPPPPASPCTPPRP